MNARHLLTAILACGTALSAPDAGAQGRGPDFGDQPRINALMVAGGCCHDYPAQTEIFMEMLQDSLPIDWTFRYEGGRSGRFVPALYEDPNWFEGYDIVVHSECYTPPDEMVSDEYLANIKRATDAGVPAVVIHCAMHTFRDEPGDLWRSVLGLHSESHGPDHNIEIQIQAPDHPVMRGIPSDWVTPEDELYSVVKLMPGTTPLASAVEPTDGSEYVNIWVHEEGARVFGTTLGHGMETWEDPVFVQLLSQGFRWAVQR